MWLWPVYLLLIFIPSLYMTLIMSALNHKSFTVMKWHIGTGALHVHLLTMEVSIGSYAWLVQPSMDGQL
jgi:hypothetical protein